jgi:hypothetical protein
MRIAHPPYIRSSHVGSWSIKAVPSITERSVLFSNAAMAPLKQPRGDRSSSRFLKLRELRKETFIVSER